LGRGGSLAALPVGGRTTLGGTTTARRPLRSFLALTLVGALAAAPALADSEETKDRINAYEDDLAALDARLDQLAAEWNATESELAGIREDEDRLEERIARTRKHLEAIQRRLERRAREIFIDGPGGTLEMLLSSTSFAEFSDRVEFVGSIAESDEDLMIEARVLREELRRDEEELDAVERRKAEQVQHLADQREEIDFRFSEVQRTIARLEDLYAEQRKDERAAAQVPPIVTGGSGGGSPLPGSIIRVCPVAGPNSFVDSFGYPRSGGRSHEGIDLISPLGTPVVAAHDGVVTRSSNSLGGITAKVQASNGYITYYAHMNGYSDAVGTVSAGTVIGYVGSTGNAGTTNHLHFGLYTPGWEAINPYQALVAVC